MVNTGLLNMTCIDYKYSISDSNHLNQKIADDHVVLVNYYDKEHIFKSPLAIIKILLHDFSCPTSA